MSLRDQTPAPAPARQRPTYQRRSDRLSAVCHVLTYAAQQMSYAGCRITTDRTLGQSARAHVRDGSHSP